MGLYDGTDNNSSPIVRSEFSEFPKTLNNLEIKCESMDKQFRAETEENKKLKADGLKNKIKFKLTKCKSRNTRLLQVNKKLNKKITKLEEELKETSFKLDKQISINAELSKENLKILEFNFTIANLKAQLTNETVKYSQLLKKNEDLKKQIDRVTRENFKIPGLNSEIRVLKEQLKQTSLKLENEFSKYSHLSLKNESLKTQLQAETILNKSNQAEIQFVRSTFLENKNEIIKLKEELKEATLALNAQNLKCARISKENLKIPDFNITIANLKEKLKQKSTELETEISKCSQLLLKNVSLEEQFKAVKKENKSNQAEIEFVKSILLETKNETIKLKEELKQTALKLNEEKLNCVKLYKENLKIQQLNIIIENLKEQHKHTSMQLSDEISKCSHIKIQQLEIKVKQLTLELERQISENIALTEYKEQLNDLPHGFSITNQSDNFTLSESFHNLEEPHDDSNCKIIIRDLPTNQIITPLENTVIVLASKMSICIDKNDIVHTNIIDRKDLSQFSLNVSLLVEFKTCDIRAKILSNRDKLKLNTFTKYVQLEEYVENETYSLYFYANKHLRANGYKIIWCQKNKVFAAKNDSDSTIEIKTRHEVDEIINPKMNINSLGILTLNWGV